MSESPILPPPFLFRFALPVRHVEEIPLRGRSLLGLDAGHELPQPSKLGGLGGWAKLRAGWNEKGLGFALEVEGKQRRPECDAREPEESDGLQLWIDTRNTQSVHRATRYCHQFSVLPLGGGKNRRSPVIEQLPVPRARDDAPLAKSSAMRAKSQVREDGYLLEVWLKGEALHGFDPEGSPRLGFAYCVRDSELGEQFATVGREFPFGSDPSLWVTLELQPE